MDREEIIRMADEAGLEGIEKAGILEHFNRFAALVAAHEREKVAKWMVERGYATGHGDTIEDLLVELSWQILDSWTEAALNGAATEREECAKIAFNAKTYLEAAAAIRARGEK